MSSVSDPSGVNQISQHDRDQPKICYTRQLWQRTMPSDTEDSNSVRGHRVSIGSAISEDRPLQRASFESITALTATQHDTSPSRSHNTEPLTPEESPPFRTSRKRSVDQVEQEIAPTTPSHSRDSSEGTFQPCLCQPEPKVPRPRNGERYRPSYRLISDFSQRSFSIVSTTTPL